MNRDQSADSEKCIKDMLGNEETRKLLIQKLKDSGHVEKDGIPDRPCTERSPRPNGPQMDNGMWPTVTLKFPFAPFPPSPYWPGPVAPLWSTGTHPSPGSAWTSKAGKNPHFGAERSLFKLQEQILEMAGSLMCLWADILSQKATVKQEDVLLLLQEQLGGVSHTITQERRRIAWGRVNPANTLPDEPEEEREVTLFGGGFLESVSRKPKNYIRLW